MKKQLLPPTALAALCAAMAALAGPASSWTDPPLDLETANPGPGPWRISAGVRAAPGIKVSAAVDARAAAARAGMPAAGRSKAVSLSPGDFASTSDGTTEADARAKLGPGYTGDGRYEFAGGYIDPNDGAGIDGETQNWHIDDASALQDGVIVLESQPFGRRTTTRSQTTRTETTTTVGMDFAEALRDDADETARGVELRLDRTVWEGARFGIDLGIGCAWYDDVDAFSVRGRACTATRTVARTTETTEFNAVSFENGTVSHTLDAPEFTNPDDIRNADGSIGGGYVVGGNLPNGYKTPVLTVTPDRFGTTVNHGPTLVGAWLAMNQSSSRDTTRHTLDVRSDGTLSMQELRLGVNPYWKACERMTLRADLGLLGTHSEIETRTRLLVDGAPAASFGKEEDDWTLGGYSGLSLGAALTSRLELSLGGELRFPHKSVRFDDGVVSGKIELAKWSTFAALSLKF